MTRILALILLTLGSVLIAPGPAKADCDEVVQSVIVQGQVQTNAVFVCSGSADAASTGGTAPPLVATGLDSLCANAALSAAADPGLFCTPAPTDTQPEVTAELVATAFRTMPLPPQQIVVQPPGGRTLVNFDTNFYTVAEPFETGLDLLGQHVDLRVRATSFRWQFGDGGTTDTTGPGAPYPSLDVVHRYLRKGTVAAGVDTTYGADFRVAGGPWTPVPGTATIVGPTQPLEVVTARPQLVGTP